MNPTEVLKTYFGHEAFRPGQQELVSALLRGQDVLGVMPTGAGKSLCYQVPALLLPGVTLVISPLISLMKDQVAALISAGVPAAYLNSSLTPRQLELATERAAQGQYRIIYVAPERLEAPSFRRFAREARIALLAVDEAHCVSQWGQDFRPHYLRIADFLAALPQRPPVGAFTATATQQVRADIIRLLGLQSPVCVTTGFDRPNLFFEVEQPADRNAALLAMLGRQEGRSGIVYCSTRKNVENVAVLLQKHGFETARYHAGLAEEERRRSQEDFQFDRVQVMVATNAFGMGIDKSNVSFVIHYNMPKSIEAYYQEAGRAGRDGSPAECVLLYSGQDVVISRFLLQKEDNSPDLSPEEQRVKRQQDMSRLQAMIDYCQRRSCLRASLLRYFGQEAPGRCDGCSVCSGGRYAWAAAQTEGRRRRTADTYDYPDRPELLPMKPGWQPGRKSAAPRSEDGSTLFEQLRACRLELARGYRVPPYIICDDKTLYDMARKCPQNPDALLDVHGMGVAKVGKYGKEFLAVLHRWRAEHPETAAPAQRQPAAEIKTVTAVPPVRPAPPSPAPAPQPPVSRGVPSAVPEPAWNREASSQLAEAYLAGAEPEALAARFCRTPAEIRARLRQLGLMI